MSLKTTIDQDLKTALLAGDKDHATILRGLKSAILNEEIAKGVRESGLTDQDIVALLKREAKKRQESADLYKKAGETEREARELKEKAAISEYLPEEMSEEAIDKLIDEAIEQVGAASTQNMGQIIGFVKQRSNGQADGGKVAAMVKARIEAA